MHATCDVPLQDQVQHLLRGTHSSLQQMTQFAQSGFLWNVSRAIRTNTTLLVIMTTDECDKMDYDVSDALYIEIH